MSLLEQAYVADFPERTPVTVLTTRALTMSYISDLAPPVLPTLLARVPTHEHRRTSWRRHPDLSRRTGSAVCHHLRSGTLLLIRSAPRRDREVGGPTVDPHKSLPGVELREREQIDLFFELARLAAGTDLAPVRSDGARYYAENPNFGPSDAIILATLLQLLRPSRYLEVGSGFTTALAIDVNEHHLRNRMVVTAIEPYPELLDEVIRPGDAIEIMAEPVQSVAVDRFASLGPNDVLFIDSSHVVKTGSDVHYLLTSVLPVLQPGVYVHFHDIFWPFEYPREWVEGGRAWNEIYCLHAFLLFNPAFEIVLWNDWVWSTQKESLGAHLPMFFEHRGGSIWLRRISDPKIRGGDSGRGRWIDRLGNGPWHRRSPPSFRACPRSAWRSDRQELPSLRGR